MRLASITYNVQPGNTYNLVMDGQFEKFVPLQRITIPNDSNSTIYLKSHFAMSIDEIFTPEVKSKTISSVLGANWSQHTNSYGTVSGQDRIHPKTGLLTLGQIFDFYTTVDKKLDFQHFTTLKDIAINCSMAMGRGVKNTHRQVQSRQAKRALIMM